jgi:hypothetical protein
MTDHSGLCLKVENHKAAALNQNFEPDYIGYILGSGSLVQLRAMPVEN